MIEPLRYYQEKSTTYEIERPAFCVSCLAQRHTRNNPNIATSFCQECPASFMHLNKQAINADKQFGAFLCRICEVNRHNKPFTEKHKRQTIVVGPGIRKKVLTRGDGINFPGPLDTVTVKMTANIYHNGRRVHKEGRRTLSFVAGLSGRCLHIQLLGARNLIVGDANGTSDPFIVATYCGRQIHSTRVRQRTLNPHWNNETVIIPVDDNMILPPDCPPSQRNLLQLAVYDHDWLSANESLGRAEISTSRLLQLATVADGQPLRIPLTMRTTAGIANLRLGHDDHYLYIEIKGAEDLPRRDPLSLFSLTWARFSLGESFTIGDTFTARGGGANVSWATSMQGKGLVFKVPMEKVLLEERRRVRMIAFYLASVGPLPTHTTNTAADRPSSGGRRKGLYANSSANDSGDGNSPKRSQQQPIDAFSAFNQLPSFLALLHLSIYEGRAPTNPAAKAVLGSPLATAALHVDTIRQLLPTLPPALPLDGEEDAPVGIMHRLTRGMTKSLSRAASSVSFRSSSGLGDIGRGYRLSSPPQKPTAMGTVTATRHAGQDLYEQANNGSFDEDNNNNDDGNDESERDGLDSFNRPASRAVAGGDGGSQVTVSLASRQEEGDNGGEDDEEMKRKQTNRNDNNDNDEHNEQEDEQEDEEEEEEEQEPSQLSDSQRSDSITNSSHKPYSQSQQQQSSSSRSTNSRRLPPPAGPPPPPPLPAAVGDNEEEEEGSGDEVPALPLRTSSSRDNNTNNHNRRSLMQRAMSFAPSGMQALGRGLSQAVESALGPSQPVTWASPLRLQLESTLPGAMSPKSSDDDRLKVDDCGYLVVRLLPASRGVVLAGLDAAVQRMTIGETAAVKCRYDQAYGSFCLTSTIPPRANILFTVSLAAISRGGVATLSLADSASFLLQLPVIGVIYRFIARFIRGLYSLYSLGLFGAVGVLFAMCKGDDEAFDRSIHESQRKAKKQSQLNRDKSWLQRILFCLPSSYFSSSRDEDDRAVDNEDDEGNDNDSNDDDEDKDRSKRRRKRKSGRRHNSNKNNGFDLDSDSDYSHSEDEEDEDYHSDEDNDNDEDGEEGEDDESEEKYSEFNHQPRTIKPDPHIKRHINTSVRAGGSLLWNYSIQTHRDPPPVSSALGGRGGKRSGKRKGDKNEILVRSSSTKRGILRSQSTKLRVLHALREEEEKQSDGDEEEDQDEEEKDDEKSDGQA